MRTRIDTDSKRFSLLAAAGIALCGFFIVLAPSARADPASLQVSVSPTSLTLALAGGPVPSGGTVPSACYLVLVTNTYPQEAGNPDVPQDGPAPAFTITGPGVNLPSNNLNSTGFGEDSNSSFGPYVFQSGGSYTIADGTSGKSVSFTATGSGSVSCSSSGSPTTTNSTPAPLTTTTTTTSTTPTSSGSTLAGTITATVSIAGKPTLVLRGRSLKTLKPGLYKIVIADDSRKAGLIVGEGSKHPLTLSGVAAVGKVTHSVTFNAGKWYFEPSTHGPKTSFVVT